MKAAYDVVVIGSGFGGAIAACRLAQAGRSVCLLEKGKRWDRIDFPRSPAEVAVKALYNRGPGGSRNGFIEYLTFRHMDVIQGIGVGGGSLHYFNVHTEPPAMIFDQPAWPRRIDALRMAPYYRVAADMLGANSISGTAGRDLPKRTQLFEAAVASSGSEAVRLKVCVHFGVDGQRALGGQPQATCQHCGNCLLGCHVHAKNTLDLNYIPLAEQLGAEVYAQHQAMKITPCCEGYDVVFDRLGPDPASDASGTVHARQIVLAGGTLGTNELLLRCKQVYRTLPRLSRQLGRHFSGNGDFLFAGTHYRDHLVDPGRGPSITSGVGYQKGQNQYIFIEDLGFPDPFIWYFNSVFPTPRRTLNLVRQLKRYCADAFGVGLNFELNKLLEDNYLTNFLPYLGMGTDGADGVLHLSARGEIELRWSVGKSKAMFKDMIGHMQDLSRASGGRFVNSFLWETPLSRRWLGKTLTAHPLGGCALSDTPAAGVVNEYGEVWGYKGLFVADGSLMPTALAVNPSATICALAERVAFHMVHQRDMEEGDAMTPLNRPAPVRRGTGRAPAVAQG